MPALTRHPHIPQLRQEWLAVDEQVKLDLYWAKAKSVTQGNDSRAKAASDKIVILQHGLEGHATRFYMIGLLNQLLAEGWDGLVWSYRGCGNSVNQSSQAYHAGFTDDLAAVVEHVRAQGHYRKIGLAGFSMGGNISFKYAGERETPPELAGVFGISVPCDLASSAEAIRAPRNWIFQRRFLKSLRKKVTEHRLRFEAKVDYDKVYAARDIVAFDDSFTAPASGFTGAADYYERSSSKNFIEHIKVPCLLLNAQNDSYLGDACYPHELAKDCPNFEMIVSKAGGHCGFSMGRKRFFHEEIGRQFFAKIG